MYVASREEPNRVDVEISISDTGCGMGSKKLDALFRELEQVSSEADNMLTDPNSDVKALPTTPKNEDGRTLGLGLAVVARIIRNANGQLRLKSEEGKGSRFVIQFPFEIPESEQQKQIDGGSSAGSATPMNEILSLHPSTGSTGSVTTPPIENTEGMVTLIERASAGAPSTRRNSSEAQRSTGMSRKSSTESVHSKKSLNSMLSARSGMSKSSNRSNKSEADRLIEAIQEPHRVEGWHDGSVQRSNSRGSGSARPALSKRHSGSGGGLSGFSPMKGRPRSIEVAPVPDHMRSQKLAGSRRSASIPGQTDVVGQGTPIRSVRMSDNGQSGSPYSTSEDRPLSAPEIDMMSSSLPEEPTLTASPANTDEPIRLDAKHMRVLVAEDDPVNSRIIKKRLEKLVHEVWLTVNGEECASTYCDNPGVFDIVLMDMQVRFTAHV
jgi:hypothetical protein